MSNVVGVREGNIPGMPLVRGAIRLTFENVNFAKVLVAKVTSVRLVLSLIWRGEAQHTLENQNWH